MTLGQLVTAVRTHVGVDIDATTAKQWINERYRSMVARARWRMAEVQIGTTVADQGRYAVSDDIVDLEGLLVGSIPYEPVGATKMFDLKAGRAAVRSGYGVFAPAFDSDAVEYIELYPAPETAGDAITGLAALKPPDLVNDSDEPQIPADLHEYLRDGVAAVGLALMDERLAEADRFEQRFEQGVQMLSARKHSRLSHGPTQIQVAGIHF